MVTILLFKVEKRFSQEKLLHFLFIMFSEDNFPQNVTSMGVTAEG